MVVRLDGSKMTEETEGMGDFDIISDSSRDKHNTHMHMILEMLDANDIDRLRETIIASSDGLFNNTLRKRAWPLLIGQDPNLDFYMKSMIKENVEFDDNAVILQKGGSTYKEQVLKDVERSFIYIDEGHDIIKLRERLTKLILEVLNAIPDIHYYQGYHDIASMVVLTLDNDSEAFEFLYILTLRYLRDHMMSSINPTMKQLDIIPELLSHVDYELFLILEEVKPVYALSSIISIFTHDITSYTDISYIWDFIFACDDPQMVIYIYVSLLIYYKDDILVDLNEMSDSSIESNGSTYNTDVVHVVLTNFIRTHLSGDSIDSKLEISNVLKVALDIKQRIPLTKLKAYKHISKFSFLKSKSTSITVLTLQIKEHEKYETKLQQKKKIMKKLNNTTLLKRRINGTPMIIKTSLGICVLGIIIHATCRNTGPRIGIGSEIGRNITNIWNCFRESLR